MREERAVQDVVDAMNNCYLVLRKGAAILTTSVSGSDIEELERRQSECEENLQRAQAYVQEWERNLAELKVIREENIRRADVLKTWTRALRQQLPGLQTVANAVSAPAQPSGLLQRHHVARPASPLSGAGACTVSFHSNASGPSENPQVLRDVINSAAAAATSQGRTGNAAQTFASKRAPRPFVTKSELDQCSSYLVGRWTQQKINAAVEELAGFAENNAKQIAALKSKVSTFKSSAARKRMLDVATVAKTNPRMQSHHWFLESDLKDGSILKCDRSGKGLLQLLRHLKRFTEIRCKIRGEADIVYVYEATA